MNEPQDAPDNGTADAGSTPGGVSVLAALSWLPVILVFAGLIFVRRMAADLDHALANIMTVGLLLLGWLFLMVALLFSKRKSWAGLVLALPFVAGLVGVALFRFERLDAELVPQFTPRWSAKRALPQDAGGEVGGDAFFVATDHDFPQYLGPDRDGRLAVTLDPAWEAQPPEIVWKQPIGEGWSGFAIQGDAAITMEQRGEQEWVTAYSVLDGTLLWQYTMDGMHTTVPGGTGPRSTPTIHQGRVYACSAVSRVVCLELETGAEIWSQDLLQLAGVEQAEFEALVTWGRAGSPLVLDDQVIVPFGGAAASSQPLICFDANTGEERWRAGSGQISYSSPSLASLDGVPQILLVSEDQLASYDPATGEELWSTEWPGKANANPAAAQPIVVSATRVLLGKGYGEGARLLNVQQADDGWQVETVWQDNKVLKTKFTTGVVRGDYAYGLSDGILECIEIATGERQWKRGRYRHGQLLLLDDHLLISSEAGELVLVPARPEEFEERFRLEVISDVSWNTLAVSGNRVLMRNSEQAACVHIPLASQASGSSEVPSTTDATPVTETSE